MNNSFESLDDHLAFQAARINIPPGDVDMVIARGRRRQWRQRALFGASSATVIAVIAGTVLVSSHHGNPPTRVASSPTPTAATTLTWRSTTPASALGNSSAVTSSSPLYALSTAPGVASDPSSRVIYRSSDGLDWSATGSPPDLYVSDLSAQGDQLYAVGTGAATTAVAGGSTVPGLAVAWTSDGGHSWSSAQLPLDTADISAGTTGNVQGDAQVASGTKGVVAFAALNAPLNLAHYAPAVSAPYGWAISPTGVDILARGAATCPSGMVAVGPASAPSGQVDSVLCMPPGGLPRRTPEPGAPGGTVKAALPRAPATSPGATPSAVAFAPNPKDITMVSPETAYGVSRSYTWSQLGVDTTVERVVLGEPFAYYSPDGTHFAASNLPLTAAQAGQVSAVATDSGFTIVTSGDEMLQSTDGTTWTVAAGPPIGNSNVAAAGILDGQVAVISQSSTNVALSTLAPDGQWSSSPIDLGSAGAPSTVMLGGAAFGPLGVVAVVSYPGSSTAGPENAVAFSSDGVHWSLQPVAGLVNGRVSGFSGAVVTSSHVVVMLQLQPNAPSDPTNPTVALVGTPS